MLKDERESKLCLGHSARLCHKLNMMDEESRSSQSLFVVGLLGPQWREKKGTKQQQQHDECNYFAFDIPRYLKFPSEGSCTKTKRERERDGRTDGMLDDGGGDEGEEAERKQKHHVCMFEVLVDHFICFGALICPLKKNTRQRRRRRKKMKQIRRKDDKVRTPSKATDQAKRYNGILYEHIKAIGCHQSALLLPL